MDEIARVDFLQSATCTAVRYVDTMYTRNCVYMVCDNGLRRVIALLSPFIVCESSCFEYKITPLTHIIACSFCTELWSSAQFVSIS